MVAIDRLGAAADGVLEVSLLLLGGEQLHKEDAKRPHRERENLVGERTRIINRMKAALIRLGIRGSAGLP